jgi:MoxR-like ATPase
MVLATQNPIEYEGTYPLAEAQLDRFLMKVVMDYPSEEEERSMLMRMHELGAASAHPATVIEAVADPATLAELRALTHRVGLDASVLDYVLRLIRQSRALPTLSLGGSPRSAMMLMIASKALALLRGREYVSPEEVQAMCPPVLRHRVRLTPEAEIEGLTPDACIQTLLQQVPVPRSNV